MIASARYFPAPWTRLDCGAEYQTRGNLPVAMRFSVLQLEKGEWLSQARFELFLATGHVVGFSHETAVSDGRVTVGLLVRESAHEK